MFIYDKINQDSYIKPEVKLEMGTLAAKIPLEVKMVEPYIQTYLHEINGLEFSVQTIKNTRTFFEKLTILHDMAHKESNFNLKYSRHYYDTYMLIMSGILEISFQDLYLLKDVVAFKNKFYYSKRSNMVDILIGKLKLIPNEAAIKAFKNDYLEMRHMFFGEIPNFDDILIKLKEVEVVLNEFVIKANPF